MVKANETQAPSQPLLLRSFTAAMAFPLKFVFRAMNRNRRQVLLKIPGMQAVYSKMAPLLISARSEAGVPCVQVNGLKMYMDPDENAGRSASFLWGQYEPATTAVIMEIVTAGDVVADVGAHWGYYTLLMASRGGSEGRVFAFEPHPRNFSILTRNLEANRLASVEAVQKAVSDRAGNVKLFQASVTTSHSLRTLPSEWTSETSPKDALDVETVSLDDFFARRAVKPRLIKMDVEGAEMLALAGMRGLIETQPSLVLIVEFNDAYMDAQSGSEFLDQFADRGLDLAIIDDDGRQLATGPKAALLKRLLTARTTCNLLATRDRALMDRLFHPQGESGKRAIHLERVRL